MMCYIFTNAADGTLMTSFGHEGNLVWWQRSGIIMLVQAYILLMLADWSFDSSNAEAQENCSNLMKCMHENDVLNL